MGEDWFGKADGAVSREGLGSGEVKSRTVPAARMAFESRAWRRSESGQRYEIRFRRPGAESWSKRAPRSQGCGLPHRTRPTSDRPNASVDGCCDVTGGADLLRPLP